MVLVIGSDTYLTLGTAPSINLGSSGNKLISLKHGYLKPVNFEILISLALKQPIFLLTAITPRV